MKRYIKTPLKYALPLLFIGALVLVSISGCTSPSSSNQVASNARTTANPTISASSSASVTPSNTPSVTPSPTPVPTNSPITLSISGPTTMTIGQGETWIVYINGQLPTLAQAAQIQWSGAPSGEKNMPDTRMIGPVGSYSMDANGAANAAPGSYTLTAMYMGVTASFTFTRLPDNLPTATPFPTATPTPTLTPTIRIV